MSKIIFFGNGKLADYALSVLEQDHEVIFHARTRDDLQAAVQIKQSTPEAMAVLASYGVLIPDSVLAVFEPTGIINLHPSLLPQYRGPSPIETAILSGETDFSISVMKLVKAMDAGPLYYQETIPGLLKIIPGEIIGAETKSHIYQCLAESGAKWLSQHLTSLPTPTPQDGTDATFTQKLVKEMGTLNPATDTAEQILRQIIAYQDFPKPRIALYGKICLIRAAHLVESGETALLPLTCTDGRQVALDIVQPEGRKPMDARSFLNGYGKLQ